MNFPGLRFFWAGAGPKDLSDAMNAATAKLPGMRAKLTFASRRFYAWWEGYAFDPDAERAALQASLTSAGGVSGRPVEDIVAEAIWGAGRLEPGTPAWTMRYARMLQLPVKASVMVFGAGAGAPLDDIDRGTRWKAHGLTHAKNVKRARLGHYSSAVERIHKPDADGALSLFQLTRDASPTVFAEIAAALVQTGAKTVFIDYAVARKGARLPACFPGGANPKTESDYRAALRSAGFFVDEAGDDTRAFLPLIEQGWTGWRRAYEAISHIEDACLRAEMMCAMRDQAELWAERYEALNSGQLRVMFLRTTRR